jgi:hypothetical protein
MRQLLLLVSGSLVLILAGVVHGVRTDRWTGQEDLAEAAARLEKLPLAIGDWQGAALDVKKEGKTGLAGTVTRRYIQRATGKEVTIFLGCGRSGPASVHTPEVCYAGSGFEVDRPRVFPVPEGEFWTSRMLKQKSDQRTQLRLFWAWSESGTWRAPDNPRLAFAGAPVLYKLYVQRELTNADDPLESDPCVDFLHSLLPALQTTLFAKPF